MPLVIYILLKIVLALKDYQMLIHGKVLFHQCELKPTDDGVSLIIRGNDPWVVIDLAPLGLPSHLRLDRVEAHLDWGS